MATDFLGFGISILSIIMAERKATKQLTFGYHRAEILGTLISVFFIWGITIFLLFEATDRIFNPVEIQSGIMVIVAVIGLCFNIIQMKILEPDEIEPNYGHPKTEEKKVAQAQPVKGSQQ